MKRLLASTRYLMIIAVLGSFLAGVMLALIGGSMTLRLIPGVFALLSGEFIEAKTIAVEFISAVDVFLLSTIFYIIALGLYELFIDDNLALPAWMRVHDLDDLKEKIIGVVIIVLGVFFLEKVVTWKDQLSFLELGISIALVIVALTYFLGQISKHGKKETRIEP